MIEQHPTRRRLLHGLALCTAMYVMPPSVAAAEPTAAPETILFLGDSITAAGGYVRAIEAELTKQQPADPIRIINRGQNSETVSGLSEAYHPGARPCLFSRLLDELENAQPDWVVACYGMNDGIYHPYDDTRFAAYKAGIRRLIKEVHSAGSRIILLTPPPYAKAGPEFPEGAQDETRKKLLADANLQANAEAVNDPNKYGYRTPYANYDQVMALYADWLLTLNGHEDVWVIDVRKAISPRITETHGEDSIHPNQLGHDLMAAAFLAQWPNIKHTAGAGQRKIPAHQKTGTLSWPDETVDTWHGFKRHLITIDGCKAWVVEPKRALPGNPWTWCMEFPDAFTSRTGVPQLLEAGFHHLHIVVGNTFGSPAALRHFDALYAAVTAKGLATRGTLIGMSRGGLYAYNWASLNPDKVVCIYGDAPVCDFRSWPGGKGQGRGSPDDWKMLIQCYGFKDEAEALRWPKNPIDRLEPLARARIPLIHVVGDVDDVVPVAENTAILEQRYRALNGDITVFHKPTVGHHPHGLDEAGPLVELVLRHTKAVVK